MKTSISKETVGTFIDAIYAIAVTILALEVPSELEEGFALGMFGLMLVEYALSFLILFALWVQHRRINGLSDAWLDNTVIWMNCGILMLVCLIPRATTLVFDYGGDVTLAQLEASLLHARGWNLAEFVDTFYVAVVIAAELGLLLLTGKTTRRTSDTEAIKVRQSKITISVLTVSVLLLSLTLPFDNRYFLLLIPLSLMFERKLGALIFR